MKFSFFLFLGRQGPQKSRCEKKKDLLQEVGACNTLNYEQYNNPSARSSAEYQSQKFLEVLI